MKYLLIVAVCLSCTMSSFAQYDTIDSLQGGMAVVTKDYKYGFVNAQKKLVIPLVYDNASAFSEGLAMVKKDGKAGYINVSNVIVFPLIYKSAGNFHKGYAKVCADGKCWLIDKQARQVTVRKYDQISQDGDYSLISLDKKWGSIDYAGQEVIAPEYDNLLYKREGLIAAKKGIRWGFIDSLDQVVLPFIYNDANSFEGGMSIASMDYNYGTIDKNGKNIIPFQYENMNKDFATGNLWAEKKNKWGMVNLKGKEIIPFKFDKVDGFIWPEGLYSVVELADKKGVIDRKGHILIPAVYEKIFACQDGYCWVGLNDKIGVAELSTGKELIHPKYDEMGYFVSGLSMVMKTGSYSKPNDKTYERYGFVNVDGAEVVSVKYEEVRNFYEGMAAVKLNGKWGFVDSTGTEVIFPRYSHVSDFVNGKAIVKQEDGELFIDKKGRLSAKPISDLSFSVDDFFNDSYMDAAGISSTGSNYQTYGKSSSTPTQQIILREAEFPTAAIVENGKLGYRIVDVSQESFGKGNWLITLNKNSLGEQTVYLLDQLSQVPQAAKKMAEKYTGYQITHISYSQKKWVVVFSQYPPVFEHKLFCSSAESGTDFPRNEIKVKFDNDFLIKRMAYGEGGWAILFTKDTTARGQSVRGWGVVNTAEIDSMKNEGFFITNLIKAENICYASFMKLKGKPTWYFQQYSTKPKPPPEELLEQGYTLYRNFYIPDK